MPEGLKNVTKNTEKRYLRLHTADTAIDFLKCLPAFDTYIDAPLSQNLVWYYMRLPVYDLNYLRGDVH